MDQNQSPVSSTPKQPYAVPIAIIIAGLLIAGSILYTRNDNTGSDVGKKDGEALPPREIAVKPVGDDDHVLGNRNAPIMFIEYSDMECPFCKSFHKTMHRLIDTFGKDGKIAWTYRHFPIEELHAKAVKEAEASECVNELSQGNKFWDYIDRIY